MYWFNTEGIFIERFFTYSVLYRRFYKLYTTQAQLQGEVYNYQEVEVELEVAGELQQQLVDTVQPLEEDRAALVGVQAGRVLPATIAEPVAKPQPLSLHQYLEPLQWAKG